MSEMFQKTQMLSKTASFYLDRTKVIQSNIANADTPGFKPKDLVFEKILDDQIELKKTDPKHIDPKSNNKMEKKLITEGRYQGYDENMVDIQKELAKLAESSIMYKSAVEAMKKEFSKLKLSISGR
ncbi:flagellar basal body rod protein FlgB [Nitrosophilus kaiyonis]|uniref:flagellar basal body rod protein FlgB n=1 Tax=Nitrosophilus kaiyonis TaxID=2930200 RepID=UPI0024931AF6|nr:flagellar basal body rod protein FlgB [Nitrosophilus kaiyonis]